MAESNANHSPSELAVEALKARLDPEQDGLLRPDAPQRSETARFRFRLPEDYLGHTRDLVIGIGAEFRKHGLTLSVEPDPGLHWPHVLHGSVCLFGNGQRPRSSEVAAVVNECIDRFHKLMHWVIPGADERARADEFNLELKSYWHTQVGLHSRPLRLLRRPPVSTPLFTLSESRIEGRIRAELIAPDAALLQDELTQVARRHERVRAPIRGAFYAKLSSQPSVQLPAPAEFFGWVVSPDVV